MPTLPLIRRHSALVLLTGLVLAACTPRSTPPTVSEVSVNPAKVSLAPGEAQNLTATVKGGAGVSQQVTWTIDNREVATVSGDGRVTALKPGNATVTVTSAADPSKTVPVPVSVVVNAKITSVSVTPTSATLVQGEAQTLSVRVEGSGGFSPDVVWSTSDPAVATVSGAGEVTAVGTGVATIAATSTLDKTKSASARITVKAPAVANARAELTNLDGGPFANWLSFSKADRDLQGNVLPSSANEHTISTLRITNTGSDTLTGTLGLTGNFTLLTPSSLSVAPGASTDVRVQFTGSAGASPVGAQVQNGTLTINSNDPTAPTRTVTLAAALQWQYENNKEPSLAQIVNGTLGFTTDLSGGGDINHKGSVLPQGDEVIAPYWQVAVANQPVTVWQLAAYHTQGNTATMSWHNKGSRTTAPVVVHNGQDAQSILPRTNGGGGLARSTFTPGSGTFGFRVDGSEWSDPALNNQQPDISSGCVQPCGQHLRFYRAKDPGGALVPNTYIVVMDYAGINYDYNDNVYLISNVRPAPILMDTGVGRANGDNVSFVDPGSNVWSSDIDAAGYKYFTPGSAVNEPATPYTGPIANTTNPQLYRTYRGNVGNLTPRTITYTIPLDNTNAATNPGYTLKLHFADLNSTVARQRVFDVFVNGQLVINDLDVFQEAGGRYVALVKTIPNVQVTNGKLTLTLTASVDYPEINGIEISR